MNRAFSADALGGDECLGRLPQAGAECRAFGAKYVLENAMFHAQQTGSISGVGAGDTGRSQTWRPARLKTDAAAIP
jgi:hypothetical protein